MIKELSSEVEFRPLPGMEHFNPLPPPPEPEDFEEEIDDEGIDLYTLSLPWILEADSEDIELNF